MTIDMSAYKMIYNDEVFNVVSIVPIYEVNDKGIPKVVTMDAWVINENGELTMIRDEGWCFKFVRR